ncbi:thermonuclease family protein [uncultured Parasphingorhabdus sp.]|uniref:thermonuclease family protein n=1 Tax=uncultured Parasphingorhabdus sp. TaxID=2709694 RepID=UPI0030DA67F7|tara:strand:- start:5904 stop:6374 length:471 start_codon:yes stop_codon:yes gene_type:complete
MDNIRWPTFITITAAMCAALFLAIFLSGGPATTSAAVGIDPHRASFGICFGSDRTTCVVDGDTIWFEGRKIRIADINTPEISSPGCASEKRLGEQAKFRLLALLNEGSFSLQSIDRDQDKYGRDLRIITRGGHSLGEILVTEGLAERWQGYRRDWC